MTTQQPDALQCAADLEYSIARHGMQDAFTLNAYSAMKMVRTQQARITELESQLAQRFDAADMATASAQGFRDGVASVSAGSEPVAFKGGMTTAEQSIELDAGFAAQNYCRAKWGAARGHFEWRRYHDAFVAGYLAAPRPSPQEGMAGWAKASKQLPPCREDQLYIGVNSAGFAGVFNAVADIAGNVHCMMETAEDSVYIMSDLDIWKPFIRPPISAAPTPAAQAADSVQEDAARESEYRRGYRHGYEQRDAEVRGALA